MPKLSNTSVIYKYPLEVTDEQIIDMPGSARLLSVQMQRGVVCLWAWVDPNAIPKKRHIVIIGTGNPISFFPGEFVGAVQQGQFVWHVFDKGEV